MTAVKILNSFNANELKDAYYEIEDKLDWYYAGTQGKQCCLQTRPDMPLWLDGCGKTDNQPDITVYDFLNPLLTGTIWEQLIKEHKMFRTRFMWMNPKSCYSVHMDSTPRIHLPIITNPEAQFYFRPGGFVYLMPSIAYWVDTRANHSFVNFSDEYRLHLVGCVLE